MPDPKEAPTEPAMGAITDRQLLVDMAQKLSGLVTTVNNVANNQADFGSKLVTLERNYEDLRDRVDMVSRRAKDPSQHDLDAQTALAAETAAREALAKEVSEIKAETKVQTAIMQRIEDRAVTWWNSPAGKTARAIAYAAAVGWLLGHNIHIPGIN